MMLNFLILHTDLHEDSKLRLLSDAFPLLALCFKWKWLIFCFCIVENGNGFTSLD